MKKTFLFTLLLFAVFAGNAQVSTLSQNFDVACATSTGFPSVWQKYNPDVTTIAQGSWQCTPTNGRKNSSGAQTPGIFCTGTWSSTNHLDTSYLITPALELSSYYAGGSGHVYLRFDTKADKFVTGGKIAVMKSHGTDTFFHSTSDSDISFMAFPLINQFDSTDWVTHEIDLSSYILAGPFFIAFRYTSSTSVGGAWYLDNVNISPTRLFVSNIDKDVRPLSVIGRSTTDKITLSFNAGEAGTYALHLYDMMGRDLYHRNIKAESAINTFTISDLNLSPGLYIIKMGNESAFSTVKVVVQ